MNINLTIFGQLVAFAVFVWFTMRFVWPPIVNALEQRKVKIADGLAAGERGQREHDLAEQRAKERLHEARLQAAEIVSKAEKRAAEIVDESKDDAHIEGDRLLTAAQSQIEMEMNKAREQLRSRVAELAIVGAEKILRKEIDAAAHRDIVDAVAAEI